MFCKQCGKEIPNAAVICVHCGVGTDNFRMSPRGIGGGTIFCGYLLAFIMPLFGIISGIYLLLQKCYLHGIIVILLSIVWIAWIALFLR